MQDQLNQLIKYAKSSKIRLTNKLSKSGYYENMGQKELRKVDEMAFSIIHSGWGVQDYDIKQKARAINNDFCQFIEDLDDPLAASSFKQNNPSLR